MRILLSILSKINLVRCTCCSTPRYTFNSIQDQLYGFLLRVCEAVQRFQFYPRSTTTSVGIELSKDLSFQFYPRSTGDLETYFPLISCPTFNSIQDQLGKCFTFYIDPNNFQFYPRSTRVLYDGQYVVYPYFQFYPRSTKSWSPRALFSIMSNFQFYPRSTR